MRLAATHAPATMALGASRTHGVLAACRRPHPLTPDPEPLSPKPLTPDPWPLPLGAHYVPLPSRGATRLLLEELGLMRTAARAAAADDGADGVAGVGGVGGVQADALCPEPSERCACSAPSSHPEP